MRDVLDIARIRQREALPRLLRQFAAQTGQLLNITRAGQAVGLESSTANRYATLLEAAFMIQRLPAWGETLGKRLSAHPKVHVIDSGLAGWLLGLNAAKINSRNPAALTEFGHLVETFAVGEILKQVSWADELITASHFRTEAGDEVDLVLETWDGRVAGFEIKAGTRIKDPDLNGLRLLRDRLGDRFAGGFVLNLGELAYRKETKIAVLPLSALWSLPGRHFSWDRSSVDGCLTYPGTGAQLGSSGGCPAGQEGKGACGGRVRFDRVDHEVLVRDVRRGDHFDVELQGACLGMRDPLADRGVVAHRVVVPPAGHVRIAVAQPLDLGRQPLVVGVPAQFHPHGRDGRRGEVGPVGDPLAGQRLTEQVVGE
jgi:hypothetical protein